MGRSQPFGLIESRVWLSDVRQGASPENTVISC